MVFLLPVMGTTENNFSQWNFPRLSLRRTSFTLAIPQTYNHNSRSCSHHKKFCISPYNHSWFFYYLSWEQQKITSPNGTSRGYRCAGRLLHLQFPKPTTITRAAVLTTKNFVFRRITTHGFFITCHGNNRK